MAAGFPSGTNTFIPDHDGSGRLVIGYSRNASRFGVAKWAKMVKAPKSLGYYLKITAQEAARVVTVQDFIWPDGATAPTGADGQESFNFLPFETKRYVYPFVLGQKATEQATWPIIESHAQIHAAQLMTARTVRSINALTTASNWTVAGSDPDMGADHTNTATVLGGGKWNVGTTSTPYIKKTLDAVAAQITLDTLSVVGDDPSIFTLLVNPNLAKAMAESAEIHSYISGSYWAMDEIRRGLTPNARYGLPSSIYGYPVQVESTVQVTSRKGATVAKSFVLPDTVGLFLSRPDGLEGQYGSPSFSTFTIFWWQDELTVEQKYDPDHRRTMGRCIEDTAEVVTAPASGFYITACT
jgi:hypothetical protein